MHDPMLDLIDAHIERYELQLDEELGEELVPDIWHVYRIHPKNRAFLGTVSALGLQDAEGKAKTIYRFGPLLVIPAESDPHPPKIQARKLRRVRHFQEGF